MIDYYIKCIREDTNGNIESVGYGDEVDENISRDLKKKEEVTSDIDNRGKTVKTVYYSERSGEWVVGDEVHTVDGEYIRTDGNDRKADNLEHLGECPR